jgi:transcriptional regulator with XRE-family HTH domain
MTKAKLLRSSIAKRLSEGMEKAGYHTRVSLAAALTKSGSPITHEALGAYFRGDALPRSEVLIGLRKVLGVSIDWLLTGEQPGESPDIKQLRQLLDHFTALLGLKEEQLDPDLQRIMNVVLALDPEQRPRLARMVEAYAEERKGA